MKDARPQAALFLQSRLRRCARGVAAVEMAFIAPILVMLALGMVDFGLGIYTKMLVSNAADAGAAYALRNASNYSAGSAATFNTAIANAAQSAVTIPTLLSNGAMTAGASEEYCCAGMTNCNATTPPSCASDLPVGTYVQVTTSTQYTTFLPYNLASSVLSFNITNPVTLTAVSTVRIQ